MPGIQNITNISALCGPSISPLPHTFMFIIQIFYGIICLLGTKNIFTGNPEVDITIDPSAALSSSSAVPEIVRAPQVFNIPENK